MKLFPLIGTLLFSAVPVQAFETYDEYVNACISSEENTKLCEGSAEWHSAVFVTNTLCKLERRGFLTAEEVTGYWEKVELDLDVNPQRGALFKEGVNYMLRIHPNCSIKPIP